MLFPKSHFGEKMLTVIEIDKLGNESILQWWLGKKKLTWMIFFTNQFLIEILNCLCTGGDEWTSGRLAPECQQLIVLA